MFQTRLVREDDALLCFETLAFLTRRYGPPSRPPVPSPLHKSRGIETLVHDAGDQRQVFDWAQDSYATLMDAMELDASEFRLVASVEGVVPTTGLLTFDPRRCDERGHFAANLIFDACEHKLDGFDPGFEPSAFQQAVIQLTAAAYFRQGIALTAMIEAATDALSGYGVPQRFVENTLVFASCLVLSVCRQSPEQIVATYGPILSKTVRKKIRPACRQIEGYAPELKLIQVMGRNQATPPRGIVRPQLGLQPQRISWT